MEQIQYDSIGRYHSFSSVYTNLMSKVFTWMTFALIITGVTAYGVATTPTFLRTLFTSDSLFLGLLLTQMVLVLVLNAVLNRLSVVMATFLFILYSVLNGVLLSGIFVLYSMASIFKVFFITAGTFGTMALYGYCTRKNLASMGKILFMALIGLVIATVVNLFMKSSGLEYIISYVGVVVFSGLTAWDMQKIRRLLQREYEDNESTQKMCLLGAMTLYLDFVNLFLNFVKILGNRK